jgi:hypothetical protein
MKTARVSAVDNMPLKVVGGVGKVNMENNDVWHMANSRQQRRSTESDVQKLPLQTVSMDLLAPFRTQSRHGEKYCFLFVDNGTRMIGKSKTDLREAIV